MAMEPRVALRNLMVAITGEDAINTGIYVGSYRQHAILQESIETLKGVVELVEESAKTKDNKDSNT